MCEQSLSCVIGPCVVKFLWVNESPPSPPYRGDTQPGDAILVHGSDDTGSVLLIYPIQNRI